LQAQLAFQVAVGDGGDHAGDASHLVGEVARHDVHVVGQVLPRAGDTLHVGLATDLAIGTHLTRHTSDFFGERIELVDHRVVGLLELEDLAADVDGDLLREVALLHGGGDLGDVADLAGQVARHDVDVVGQVFPDPADPVDLGLAAQPALGADLARHARDFVGEGVQLVDHRVDGLLELEDLAADVDGDLLGEVALLHGGGDLGDVAATPRHADLHDVDVVGQVFPDAGDALDLGLAAELALGAHLTRHARDLIGEGVELVDHG